MTARRLSWAATAFLLVLSVAIVVLAFYPGLTNPDTNQTWDQARNHYVLDWWTPFGSYLLRAWLRVGLSLTAVWIVQTILFVAGAWFLLRHVLPDPWAAAGALLVTGWPPTYSQLTEIARDVFFMAFALIALGALAAAYRAGPERPRWRWTWLAVALIAAMASYLSRQNGVVVVIGVVLGALPLLAGPRIAALGRWRRVFAAIAVALVTGLVAFGFSTAMNRVLGVTATHPERMLYVYDLASISESSGHDYFPADLVRRHRAGWVTPYVDQRTLDREFNWLNVISLYPGDLAGRIAFTDGALAAREADELRGAWRHAVGAEPATYLWGRLRLTASILGLSNHPTNAFYGPLEPTNYGRPLQFDHGVKLAADVIRPFVGPTADIPLDIHWPYLLASIGFVWFLWRRRPGDRPLLLAIAIAQWANIAVDFLFAPATSYSYSDLSPPLALVLAMWTVAELVVARRLASR